MLHTGIPARGRGGYVDVVVADRDRRDNGKIRRGGKDRLADLVSELADDRLDIARGRDDLLCGHGALWLGHHELVTREGLEGIVEKLRGQKDAGHWLQFSLDRGRVRVHMLVLAQPDERPRHRRAAKLPARVSVLPNRRGPRPHRRTRRLGLWAVSLITSATVVSACGSANEGAIGPIPQVVAASLATSLETPAGTWATVPMGHLDQPLNTFWQLFFRPPSASTWSDEASALAVATNGGLVLATNAKEPLTVGIRPTNYLGFSPLITTLNARSWTPANPIGALGDQPDALALSATGQGLALVSNGRTRKVLTSPDSLLSWRTLVEERGLAGSPAGRRCGLASLTAVSYLGSEPLIGASCTRGTIGIFTEDRGTWRLLGHSLSSPLKASGAQVLGFERTTAGLCALVSVKVGRSAELIVTCATERQQDWRASPALKLAGTSDVISFGPTAGQGLFVLVSDPARRRSLAVIGSRTLTWSHLQTPPSGTVTVAVSASGAVDALSVDDTLFSDWRLMRRSHRWQRIQQSRIPIEFGSSS